MVLVPETGDADFPATIDAIAGRSNAVFTLHDDIDIIRRIDAGGNPVATRITSPIVCIPIQSQGLHAVVIADLPIVKHIPFANGIDLCSTNPDVVDFHDCSVGGDAGSFIKRLTELIVFSGTPTVSVCPSSFTFSVSSAARV